MRTKSAMGWSLSLFLLASSLACSACSDGGGSGGPNNNPPPGQVEENTVKGRAVDTQGNPLAGADVVADNEFLYDSNVVGKTGADGTYRLPLGNAASTWNVSAQIQRQYNGRTYTMDLHPLNPASFETKGGAVRDFEWRLTGPRPQGGTYGSKVIVYMSDLVDPADGSTAIDDRNIELTLTPDGPRVDGSTGAPVTARVTSTTDGSGLEDVALGRYTITARYAPQGQAARTLQLRKRNSGSYAESATVEFDTLSTSLHMMELDVKFP